MFSRNRWFVSTLGLAVLLGTLCSSEQEGLLQSLPADILASLTEGDLLAATGKLGGQGSKGGRSMLGSLGLADEGADIGAAMKMMQNVMTKQTMPKTPFKPGAELFGGIKPGIGFSKGVLPIPIPVPVPGKMLKAIPLKKKVVLKTAVGAKLMAPKLKKFVALKAKPKVFSLKPIVHIVEKPVPVFHKVPYPKKVIVPKFYKVMKPIPFPKIVPVPFKVPVKKIIPKIVKIPKAVLIPKFYPVKKFIPIGIPYPVPKFYKVPIPKPMPYKKFIPIPIPKKVPKFIPVPIKKIIKVPKPFYVPIKVPYITTSYMKTPMIVKVPDIKKPSFKLPVPSFKFPVPKAIKGFPQQVNFIPAEDKQVYKVQDKDSDKAYKYKVQDKDSDKAYNKH